MFAFSVPSHADSDGYFCSYKGYLAYELREGITPGIVGHVLRVTRFDSQHGIRVAGELILMDLQVHMMACDDRHIEIAGYGTVRQGDAPLTTCEIELGGPTKKVSIVGCNDAMGQHGWRTERPEPMNLCQWARAKSIALESPDSVDTYELLLDVSNKKVDENSYEVHYKTELVQTNAQENVSQRFVVYEARIVASDSGD